MESKLCKSPYEVVRGLGTFNRTSMESKQITDTSGFEDSQFLLIEPVWNRNDDEIANHATIFTLLIEPVWNRNVGWWLFSHSAFYLLIEPVWNRNRSYIKETWHGSATFNRTSMESKLITHPV